MNANQAQKLIHSLGQGDRVIAVHSSGDKLHGTVIGIHGHPTANKVALETDQGFATITLDMLVSSLFTLYTR